MKKTLIALAVLAVSGAAFAQTSVSISGVLEIAPLNSQKVSTQAAGADSSVVNVKTSRTSQHNTWSTSVINFSGTQDLGDGLKASAVMISGVDNGFAVRERTLGLSNNMGALRFGRFVPAPISGYHSLSGSASATFVGSMYGLITGSTAQNFIHGEDAARANMERIDNVLQYTSPSINGVTVNLYTARNSVDSDAAAAGGKANTSQTGVHLGYAAGPLSLGVATNSATSETESAAAVGATPAVVGNKREFDVVWFGGSYDLGAARLFAAYATRENKTAGATNADIKLMSFGVSVPLGATTLRASMYNGTDKRTAAATDNMELSGYQFSAAYALGKSTSLIGAIGKNDIKRDSGSTGAARKTTATTVTLNHTF